MNIPLNRGMFLETVINQTIQTYQNNDLALIYKRPVDIIPLEKNNNLITKSYFKNKSTCDYYGLYHGYYIEFEAKETHQTKFNLQNIKTHQLKQLSLVYKHLGISFIIVYFHQYDRYFFLPYLAIVKWTTTMNTKQIPLSFFEEYGYELFLILPNLLDFIPILNQLISCI